MISLEEYSKTLFQFAVNEEVKNHLCCTVIRPLLKGGATSEGSPNGSSELEDEALRLYAFPPMATSLRLAGLINGHTLLGKDGIVEHDNKICYHVSTLDRLGLPFCITIEPVGKALLCSSHPSAFCTTATTEIPVVVVNIGCAEALLRGSDAYAPGVHTFSKHFHKGENVIVAVQITREVVTNSSRKGENDAFSPFYRWKTTASRGSILRRELFETLASTKGHSNLDCLVWLGEGVAQMDSKIIMSDPKLKGVGIRMIKNAFFQPSQETILSLLMKNELWKSLSCVGDSQKKIFLQNFSSMLPPILLVRHLFGSGSKPKNYRDMTPCILDACAAPGGKASLLLTLLLDQLNKSTESTTRPNEDPPFRLVCCERSRSRCDLLTKLLKSHFDDCLCSGKGNGSLPELCQCLCCDVNQLAKVKIKGFMELADGQEAKRASISSFFDFIGENKRTGGLDAILLDPPCTGMGLRPKLVPHPHKIVDIKQSADYQRKLFDASIQLLSTSAGADNLLEPKIIVYSTCTITLEENEENVLYFLTKYKGLFLARANAVEEEHLCEDYNASFTVDSFSSSNSTGAAPFLLYEDICAAQTEKEKARTGIKQNESSLEEEKRFLPPLLVVRLMPTLRNSTIEGGAAYPLDGVGFFVAVFEYYG